MQFRRALLLLAAPLLLTACPGGKNKDKDKTVDTDIRLPPPSVSLVVAGIDPTLALPDTAFQAEVVGTGFVRGASVELSGKAAEHVTFSDDSTLQVSVPALPEGVYDVTVINPDGSRATLRRGLHIAPAVAAGCDTVIVHFELDSTGLFPDDLTRLQAAAACFAKSNARVKVEGHCDERGTTEYNLALGQRRADSTSAVLSSAGIPRSRIDSVTYGEERPADAGHDESAWSQNRRAVIYLEN